LEVWLMAFVLRFIIEKGGQGGSLSSF
jgi:hypothetical protein